MKNNPLADEILGHLRDDSTDDFPAASGLPVPQFGVEPSPLFDELFSYRPATGRANNLVKAAELDALRQTILGHDVDEVCSTARASTAGSLDQRIVQIGGAFLDKLVEKSARVAAGAPVRKSVIERIINKFRQALVTKGYAAHSDTVVHQPGRNSEFRGVNESTLESFEGISMDPSDSGASRDVRARFEKCWMTGSGGNCCK